MSIVSKCYDALDLRTLVQLVIGGIIFCLVFYIRYSFIDPSLYAVRDDGVITMSHAKNLVDYGFIGVNPSGERVEGYSAPVQFLLMVLLYGFFGFDYVQLSNIQTWCFSFLLGAVVALFFRKDFKDTLIYTSLAAIILSLNSSFLLWHGSGMENPITNVLFLLALYTLYRAVDLRKVDYKMVLVVFLATVSRVDSVYHIAPLLLFFSVYWYVDKRSFDGLLFSVSVGICWVLFNIARYMYFGEVLPNTAAAQAISVSDRLWSTLLFDLDYWGRTLPTSGIILSKLGYYLALSAAPLLLISNLNRQTWFLLAGCSMFLLTSFFSPFVFGDARLDTTRTVSFAAVFTTMVGLVVIHKSPPNRLGLVVLPIVILLSSVAIYTNYEKPGYKCCPATAFEAVSSDVRSVADKEQISRPLVAVPDLGAASWHKEFNILDIGWLGSRVLSKLRSTAKTLDDRQNITNAALSEYFFNVAAPDILQAHGWWVCWYSNDIFDHPLFDQKYEALVTHRVQYRCGSKTHVFNGLWVRKDIRRNSKSRERQFMETVSGNISAELFEAELKMCEQASGTDCRYIARTAYRFLPELRFLGQDEQLIDIFSKGPTKDYDLYLLQGSKNTKSLNLALDAIKPRP